MIRLLLKAPLVVAGCVLDELRYRRRTIVDSLESEPGMREWFVDMNEQIASYMRSRNAP